MNTLGNSVVDFLKPGDAIVRYGYISDFSIGRLLGVLEPSEKTRADKFYLAADRIQYITCRAILKLLLSPYLGIDAVDIQLQYSPNGKPTVPGMNAIQFNVSHCRNIMMWGISNGNTIGVDVEHMDRQVSPGALMSVCSEAELHKIQSVPEHQRHECFINCWTRKEALLKAVGSLSFPLQQFEVSIENEKVEVLATPWSKMEKDQWYLRSLDLPDNYRGAVAIKGKVSHLDINRLNGTSISYWQTQDVFLPHSYSSIQFDP